MQGPWWPPGLICSEPKPSPDRSLHQCHRESIFEDCKRRYKGSRVTWMRMAPSETLRQCIIAMLEHSTGIQRVHRGHLKHSSKLEAATATPAARSRPRACTRLLAGKQQPQTRCWLLSLGKQQGWIPLEQRM